MSAVGVTRGSRVGAVEVNGMLTGGRHWNSGAVRRGCVACDPPQTHRSAAAPYLGTQI